MINLRVMVPDDTINYVKNPNFRYDTSGWTVFGATLTRTLDYARFGIAGGKVVLAGSVLNEGVYYRTLELSGTQGPVTVSCYVRGSGGKVRIKLRDTNGTVWFSQPFALDDRWNRLEVTGNIIGRDDVRLYVESAETTAKVLTYYVGGAQIENKAYSTFFCDGEQAGCYWTGPRSASKSVRIGTTRQGGRWINLAGPCRGDNNIYVTKLSGFGMAPITNSVQEWAQAPGGFYQSTKVNSRAVSLDFYVKNAQNQQVTNPSLSPLHGLRQQLIDLFKPDKTEGGEAYLFEYSDTEGTKPLYLWLRYEAGLTGEWDIRNAFVNSMSVRMLAVDPIWQEDNQDVLQLGVKQNFASGTQPLWKKDYTGKWNQLITSSNMVILCMAMSPDGILYIGGNNGVSSNSTIWKWDGTTLTGLAALNSIPRDMDFGLDGTLYVGGDFTTVNGSAINRIAKYVPSTATWSAVGTGANGSVHSVCAAQNNQIYLGGGFTTLGGVTCQHIGRWDGIQFRTVGATSGVDGASSGTVESIRRGIDPDTLLVSGYFDYGYGGNPTYNKVCTLNTSTNLLSALESGLSGKYISWVMVQGLDGTLYACSTDNPSGANPTLWRFIGNTWESILTVNGEIRDMRIGNLGELYISGYFTSTSQGDMYKMGVLYNNVWNTLEGQFVNSASASATIYKMLILKNGEIYVGALNPDVFQAFTPYYNTITNNGTTAVYPLLYIKGQGTLRYIENLKNRKALYLNLVVYSGEEVFIDFARGTIESTVRGRLLSAIQPGSEIRGMYLLPGDNTFAVLMDNEVSPICQLRWGLQHWSADAIQTVDAL